jgi:hypothetical protein
MNESSTLCTAADHGHACRTGASMLEPVALCDHHRLQVALLVVPDVLAETMRQLATAQTPKTLPDDERDALVAGAHALDLRAYLNVGMHGPIVYFIENGDRVKIGFSTNLRARIQAFALQEKNVLMILGGGLTMERALHSVFAADRIDATEWFRKSEQLVAFIDAKLAVLDGQRSRTAQSHQRKQMIVPQQGIGEARRKLEDWVTIAMPLYLHHKATTGRAPAAPKLAELLAEHGHGHFKPSRARDIRRATANEVNGSAGAQRGAQ